MDLATGKVRLLFKTMFGAIRRGTIKEAWGFPKGIHLIPRTSRLGRSISLAIKRTQVFSGSVVAVGDPVRPALRRAVKLTIFATLLFMAFAFVDKELPWLYIHEPWQNDPYDTFVSFSMIFTPLLFVVTFMKIPLFKKGSELSNRRVCELIRGCRLLVSLAMITLLADWESAALRVDLPTWTFSTGVSIILLLATTCFVCITAADLMRLSIGNNSSEVDLLSGDGLGDAILVIRGHTKYLGSVRGNSESLVNWVEKRINEMRTRPLIAAATISATIAVAVASMQTIGEGIRGGLAFAFFFGVTWCGMYAFIVMGGRQLGLIQSVRPAHGMKRQLINASVASASVVPLGVAFRNPLANLFGIAVDTPKEMGALLIGAAAATMLVVFLGESLTKRYFRGNQSF